MDAPNLDEAAQFIAALTGEEGWRAQMFFQTFDDCAAKKRELVRTFVGSMREHAAALSRLNREGACIAVAVNRLRGRRRLLEEVVSVRSLFINCDGPRRKPLVLPTSITVLSRAGRHFYWLLREAALPAAFADAQRQLATFYGADGMVCDPTRVMRLPGFDHCKGERFRVRLVRADAALRYGVSDIIAAHPVEPRAAHARRSECASEPQNEAMDAFRRWTAAAPRLPGDRNTTAFAMAAEGHRSGVAPAEVAREVHDYCKRAGIACEADAVLRSVALRTKRR